MFRRRESGFSLIEVVMALALLAAVLISISGLFVLGHKQAKSGRTASEALALAGSIHEEMQRWGFRQTYLQYGFDGTATSYSADTRTNSYADKWQPVIEGRLFNGYAIIDLQSLPDGTPPAMNASRAIRVLVTVHWDENQRHRTVVLSTVRM